MASPTSYPVVFHQGPLAISSCTLDCSSCNRTVPSRGLGSSSPSPRQRHSLFQNLHAGHPAWARWCVAGGPVGAPWCDAPSPDVTAAEQLTTPACSDSDLLADPAWYHMNDIFILLQRLPIKENVKEREHKKITSSSAHWESCRHASSRRSMTFLKYLHSKDLDSDSVKFRTRSKSSSPWENK